MYSFVSDFVSQNEIMGFICVADVSIVYYLLKLQIGFHCINKPQYIKLCEFSIHTLQTNVRIIQFIRCIFTYECAIFLLMNIWIVSASQLLFIKLFLNIFFCTSLNVSSTYFGLAPKNSVCLILEIFTLQPLLPHKHTDGVFSFFQVCPDKLEYMDSLSIKQVDMITFHSRHILQEKHCVCSAKISSFL